WSRMDLEDTLVIDEQRAPSGLSVTILDGEQIRLTAHDRLHLSAGAATGAAFRVRLESGVQADIPREQVEGAAAVFRRLPGVRELSHTVDLTTIAFAALLLGPAVFLAGVRWLFLLRGCDVDIP